MKKQKLGILILIVSMGLTLSACQSVMPTPLPQNLTPPPTQQESVQNDIPTTISATDESSTQTSDFSEYEIITLLPRDAIPAIDDPQFLSAIEADQVYRPDELVIGVDFDGDARAYSIPLLSKHEIVNDTVSGRKIAVTW